MISIYLDAGHGGKDGGASANGIKEKDVVLTICKKIEEQLNSFEDVKVIQSRETDVFLTLEERTKQANNLDADVLLSVHCNAHTNTSANGFESYRYTHTTAGTTSFHNVMHEEIMKALGNEVSDRGKKTANFHMLRESKMKAVLTENLFVTSSSDSKKLKDDAFLDKLATGHVNGLQKFLGLKRKVERPPQKPIVEKLYKVQVGAFEKKENAEALASDLQKLGYRPFVKYE